MAARFTKDGEQASNLYDMQCTWYEIECGTAHLRRHELGQVSGCGSTTSQPAFSWPHDNHECTSVVEADN